MPLTEQHIACIHSFITGRIMRALYDAEHGHSTDEETRIIRALHEVVVSLGARAGLSSATLPEYLAADHRAAMDSGISMVLEFAWTDLQAIARQWRDHPAYLPEFDLHATELTAVETEMP